MEENKEKREKELSGIDTEAELSAQEPKLSADDSAGENSLKLSPENKEESKTTIAEEDTQIDTIEQKTDAPNANEQDKAEQFDESKIQKQRKRNRFGFILSLIIIGCVVYALWKLSDALLKGDTATFYEMLSGMNWWYILLAYVLFVVMFIMESLKFTLLGKCNGCSLGFKKDMKTALIGKYYECITPFSTGGQPMQIYYLYKEGVSTAKGASIAMVKYGVHMLGFTLVAALVMGFGVNQLGDLISNDATRKVILICGWIGFGINAFIPVFVTLVVFLPKPVAWIVNLCVKILHKIRIIRNPQKLEAKVRQWVDDFSIFSQFFYKKPLSFFLLFLLCLGEPIIELVFPYLVLLAMVGGDVAGMQGSQLFFAVVILAMYATYAATFVPTPGNSGAIEMIFMAAFATMTENILFWYVLFWRFILYYTWIILGLGMNITDFAGRIRRRRKERLAYMKKE